MAKQTIQFEPPFPFLITKTEATATVTVEPMPLKSDWLEFPKPEIDPEVLATEIRISAKCSFARLDSLKADAVARLNVHPDQFEQWVYADACS